MTCVAAILVLDPVPTTITVSPTLTSLADPLDDVVTLVEAEVSTFVLAPL